ncbi:MAG: 50S ribosomal protein L23 [Candidatus Gribaldobacteria bacterium]|nr:50S ribosomal protein L23 [Candidatus Gribaldobacteria bacterium]
MLLDRFKKNARRLSNTNKLAGRHKEKGQLNTKEQQIEKIKEKKSKEVAQSVVVDNKPTDKKHKTKSASFVLVSPQITEKAVNIQDDNQYVFKVTAKANKSEVKKAVEGVYNVDVLKVRVINVPPKKKRLGRTMGWQAGYKKAIVSVKKGQVIEILPR